MFQVEVSNNNNNNNNNKNFIPLGGFSAVKSKTYMYKH